MRLLTLLRDLFNVPTGLYHSSLTLLAQSTQWQTPPPTVRYNLPDEVVKEGAD